MMLYPHGPGTGQSDLDFPDCLLKGREPFHQRYQYFYLLSSELDFCVSSENFNQNQYKEKNKPFFLLIQIIHERVFSKKE